MRNLLVVIGLVLLYLLLVAGHFAIEDRGRLRFEAPVWRESHRVPRDRAGLEQARREQLAREQLAAWLPYRLDQVFWHGSIVLCFAGVFLLGLHQGLVRRRREPLPQRLGALLAIYTVWFPAALLLSGLLMLPLVLSRQYFLTHAPGAISAWVGWR